MWLLLVESNVLRYAKDWTFISQWDVDQAAAAVATNSANVNIAMKTDSNSESDNKTFVIN
jgi:hypothetical protein